MTPQEKLENFICDKDAFKKWWNAATDVTGDEHTAWLAWRAAIIHAEIENAKATPTADTGLAREIAENVCTYLDNESKRDKKWIEDFVAKRLSTREQEVAQLIEAAIKARWHIQELREAWERGAISEHDGKGGTRSNRNADMDRLLGAALDKVRGRG